uniref:Uncharacterized protein n=1 Tax=Oryza brachyantha TaxID=4533 RepID=J3M242_ORYBR
MQPTKFKQEHKGSSHYMGHTAILNTEKKAPSSTNKSLNRTSTQTEQVSFKQQCKLQFSF